MKYAIITALLLASLPTTADAGEPTYGGYTFDQLGSYAGSSTKEEHEASVRAHERAEAVRDAARRAESNARSTANERWFQDGYGNVVKKPATYITDKEWMAMKADASEITKWKAAYEREQSRAERRRNKKG